MEEQIKELPSVLAVVSGTVREGEMIPEKSRHFNLWSTLGINYASIGTPLAIGTYLAFGIGVGGSPVYIYGYLVCLVFQLVVCVSLAELAAAFPHSTGQVHWARVLAPPKYATALSYWTGAFTAAAYFFYTCGTFLFTGELILALVSMTHASYTSQQYQVFLVYVAAVLFSVVTNTVFFKSYSYAMRWLMIYLNVATVIFMVTLLVRATPKRSAHAVFVEFVNETGWHSDGFVFLLGLLSGNSAITCFDSATHVTDEVPDPARQVPQVMIGTTVLAGISGLPMTMVYMFCVTNEANLLAPIGGQPFAQLILDSCRSQTLSVLLMVLLIILYIVACSSFITTMSRILWSLAEIEHMVCSNWLRKVSSNKQLPVNAIFTTAILASLFGLLGLGPATALNAIVGSGVVSLYISYVIPLSCVFLDRTKLTSTARYINLGKFGIVINFVAMGWMLLMIVVLMFPQYLPVTAAYMNYTVAVIAGVIIVYTVNWFAYSRTRYRPETTRSVRISVQNDI